jgi:hypothetical protein
MTIAEKIATMENITYTAIIDGADWMEVTNTFDEALDLLRGLVEADGKHIFQKVNNWVFQSHGANASAVARVIWTNTTNGKQESKGIRVNGFVKGDMPKPPRMPRPWEVEG